MLLRTLRTYPPDLDPSWGSPTGSVRDSLARIFREARNIRPGGADSVGANRDPADAGSPGQAAGGNFGSFTLWFMKFLG